MQNCIIFFVAHRSEQSRKEYCRFLEELGYKVFTKSAGFNFSLGKLKWRPYGKGWGQLATNPGSYNKEILVVEKRFDGKPFALYTTNLDKANYYRPIKNAWLAAALVLLAFAVREYAREGLSAAGFIGFGILGILCAVPVILYQRKISFLSARAKIEEGDGTVSPPKRL